MWMSAVYEELLVDVEPNITLCVGQVSNDQPVNTKMDKSVFSRILKVVIQCVEEGSALLHNFKMEGDVSKTKITIEFHSQSESYSLQRKSNSSSHDGDPGPKSEPKPEPGKPRNMSKDPDHWRHNNGESIGESNPHKPGHSMGNNHVATYENCDIDRSDKPNGHCEGIIPNGSTLPVHRNEDMTKKLPTNSIEKLPSNSFHEGNMSHCDGKSKASSSDSHCVSPRTKRIHNGVSLEQVIDDQNQIPTQKVQNEPCESISSTAWGFDSNQNTVRRKDKNILIKSRDQEERDISRSMTKTPDRVLSDDIPKTMKHQTSIESEIIPCIQSTNKSGPPDIKPKPGLKNTQMAQLMQHPSFISRLARMTEPEDQTQSNQSNGSSDGDSSGSEDDPDTITDARQFNQSQRQKRLKQRKSIIAL